jgi:Ca2+-binding RTX toxin-like protein
VTSLKSTDADGNVLTVTGNLKYDYKVSDVLSYAMSPLDFTGTVTGISLKMGGQNIVATRLSLSYGDIDGLTGSYTVKDLLPYALSGNDTLTVSATDSLGSNTVYGYAGNDKITGSALADILDGGAGNDNLIGGAGDDALIGGAGKDTFTGGTGADTFSFAALADLGADSKTMDTIKDFKTAEGDKIDLSGIGSFTWGGSTAPTGDATNLVWFTKGVVYISTDADVAAECQIGLTGVKTLAATDFTSIVSLT